MRSPGTLDVSGLSGVSDAAFRTPTSSPARPPFGGVVAAGYGKASPPQSRFSFFGSMRQPSEVAALIESLSPVPQGDPELPVVPSTWVSGRKRAGSTDRFKTLTPFQAPVRSIASAVEQDSVLTRDPGSVVPSAYFARRGGVDSIADESAMPTARRLSYLGS